MMNKIFGAVCALLLASQSLFAQNLLVNGDFESTPTSVYGDNLGADISPWQYDEQTAAANPSSFWQISVMKLNSSAAGFAQAAPTTITSALLTHMPSTDADLATGQDGNAIRLHFRLHGAVGLPALNQKFTPPRDGCVQWGLSTYDFGWSSQPKRLSAVLYHVIGAPDLTSGQLTYSGGPGLASVSQMVWKTVAQSRTWQEFSDYATVQAGEDYYFAHWPVPGAAYDNYFVRYVDRSHCLTAQPATPVAGPVVSSPAMILPTAQDAQVIKTCEPPQYGVLNGENGMFWNCQIAVDVAAAPFAGSLTVEDVFDDLAPLLTEWASAQYLSMSSQSGASWDCSSGNSCVISGADFPASGQDVIDVQMFVVTGTPGPDEPSLPGGALPFENCAQATWQDGSNQAYIGESCVNAQWQPQLSVVKTCDPVEPVSPDTYTLTCHITATGTNLYTGDYAVFMDGFGPIAGTQAAISGTMMNISSSEPWQCVDAAANVGVCELSAVDLHNAGGSSTVDITFQFDATAGDGGGQVANCAIGEPYPGPLVGNLGQGGAMPTVERPVLPHQLRTAILPDYCVQIDLPNSGDPEPDDPNPPKLEDVHLEKSCEMPIEAVVNGQNGFLWECQVVIDVTPAPFDGTFTLFDDASQISVGVAQFLNVTDPNCTGLGTDQLTCHLDGNTMSSPTVIGYKLFTPLADPGQPIEWRNCAAGVAETVVDQIETPKSCTETVIKPTGKPLPEADEIGLEKICEEPQMTEVDGVSGMLWQCRVHVTASPAPFAGVFSFTEDASNVSGAPNAAIIGYSATNPAWLCTPAAPAQTVDCMIPGAVFAPSGHEAVDFSLFAPTAGEPVKWQNCVSGAYGAPGQEPRRIKGNCVEAETPRPDPADLVLKKSCRIVRQEGDDVLYVCSIQVGNNGGPVTGPVIVDELFHNLQGTPAGQYIFSLTGSPAGWSCTQPPFANGASCTISAADFNAGSGHQIMALMSIPSGALHEQDFENCASVSEAGSEAGQDCVPLPEPEPARPEIDKTCAPLGPRQNFSATAWVQAYQCTITITSPPFTGPLTVSEGLSYGAQPANNTIVGLSSADPWNCTQPPFAPQGAVGTQPSCEIDGSQFPASGQSQINVTFNLVGAYADIYGAENCAGLTAGKDPMVIILGESCVQLADPLPQDPVLDITKTCSKPTQNTATQIWDVNCTITLTGANLPAGQNIHISDELMSSPLQSALNGILNPAGGAGACNSNLAVPGGVGSGCVISSDDLAAAGGSMSFTFTGHYQGGAGMAVNGPKAQNCTFADMGALHAPAGAIGKICVPLNFLERVDPNVGGGLIGGPAVPDIPRLAITKRQTAPCQVNRDRQRYDDCGFRISVTNTGTAPYTGTLSVLDRAGKPGMSSAQVRAGEGWECNRLGNALTCSNGEVTLAPGESATFDLSMKVPGLRQGGRLQNCAQLGVPENRALRVALIQQIMNARGLDAGPVDGKPGRRTYRALAQLQRQLGLPETRNFDDALFTSLGFNTGEPLRECVSAKLAPIPAPALQCDPKTTVSSGDSCVCIDRENAVKTSPTTCGCRNGLPMINGRCLSIRITPKTPKEDRPDSDGCRLRINGICLN